MQIDIREIHVPEEKSALCERVLRALPDWFGIESAIVDYVDKVRPMPFYAAFAGEDAVGFAALKIHNPYTAEVYVMGVLPEFHRCGAGRLLIRRCEAHCREEARAFLTVKTLDASREDAEYAKTRLFYQSVGFVPLEVFPLLWDEANPCLFMAKALGAAELSSHGA